MANAQPDVKGRWFGGDRTIEQQMMGLDRLFADVEGKSVLDVGCAEGLIAMECAKSGAAMVRAGEIRKDAVAWARHHREHDKLLKHKDIIFWEQDANVWQPQASYDIVLMLAVLHKLEDPSAACKRFARVARDLVVIRLPPGHAPTIIDSRSGNVPHDIDTAVLTSGFYLEHAGYNGPFGEWVGYYRRRSA
jgi:ubiquinone/menaquinone biosynthesis C-methylase UbiE